MIRITILLALLCLPLAAAADPISLVATLAPIFGSTVAGFIVSYGGYIAFGGLQLLGAANARRKQRAAAAKQRAAYNAGLQDRNVTVLTNEANWRVVYGSPAPIGGVTVAVLTSGAIDEYQHMVIVMASHESQAIDEILLDGDPIGGLDANGWATSGEFYERQPDATVTELVNFVAGVGTLPRTPVSVFSVVSGTPGRESADYVQHTYSAAGATITLDSSATVTASVTYSYASYVSRVRVGKHLSPGGVDTADAYLMSAAPSQWTAAHKISGHTYIVLTLDLRLARFQGGPPNVSVKLRGKKVYDYRTGTTAYSANAALCAADFIASQYGYGATTAQVDTATAQAAANDCDAQGFECHGLIDTGNARDANLQQLEDAFAGASHYSGGVWRIMAGAWSTPVMTLTDALMAAPIEVVQASEPADRRYTGARGKYAPASGLGVADDFTPYIIDSYATADGIERLKDMELGFTGTNAQCQKLAAIAVERSRLGLTINYPAHFGAWKLQPGDRVYVANPELGFVAKTFRLVDWTYIATAPIGLVLTEDVASAYTGTFSAQDPTRATSNLADPFARPQAPANLQVNSGTDLLIKGNDGTIITRARITWEPSTVRAVLQGGYTQVRWRNADALDDVWINVDLSADSAGTVIGNLPDGQVIVVQVRFVTGASALGHWATLTHTVVGKTEPPPDVQIFTRDGLRLSWMGVGALDLAGYQIRFNYGINTWWESAANLHEGLLTSSPYVMTQRPSGQITLLIRAVDTSGNVSAASAIITADLGDLDLANLLLSYPQAPGWTDGVLTGGSVVSGAIEADDTDLFFGPDSEPFFGAGTAVFYDASTYASMAYEWTVSLTDVGLLQLQHSITASQYGIEYRRDSQEVFYGADDGLFYDDVDTEPFFGQPGAWSVWPGSIVITSNEQVQLRISTAGGAQQGVVSVATVVLDVPDIVEQVNDLVVSPSGTRLPLERSYRAISNVLLTVQADGNGGITSIVDDKSATLGPLVRVLDASGSAVAGLIDATVQGY